MYNIYDIRSSANARKTLAGLSGVDISIWEKFVGREDEYRYTDDLVKEVTETYGQIPDDYHNFNFIYFHVTTSANECASIKKFGILDLKQAYLCEESELRVFLEQHGISVDLANAVLMYREKNYNISFERGSCPRDNTQEYLCWSIGRKFYYDYTTCGFLSVWKEIPYGGQVHQRPEILWDIDNLLNTDLSEEWRQSHVPYEITAEVSGDDIIFDGDEGMSDGDKVLMYLTRAYDTAFGAPSEHVLLLKDGIQVLPDRVLEIKPLSCWN